MQAYISVDKKILLSWVHTGSSSISSQLRFSSHFPANWQISASSKLMKIHGCFHSSSLGQNSKTFALDQTFEYLRGRKKNPHHFSNVNTQSEMWLFLTFLDAWKFSTNFYNSHSAGFCYKCSRNYLGKYSIEREGRII